jgi:NADH dehydrogenase
MSARQEHVVVIGAGFAGLAVAKGLLGSGVRVTVIDKRNFHLFQPLLYQVATGALSPANIATPVRSLFKRDPRFHVRLDEVMAIDLQSRQVMLADSDTPVSFDTLVVATGMQTQYFGNDHWAAMAPGLKTVEDALEIRNGSRTDAARPDVCGGGRRSDRSGIGRRHRRDCPLHAGR